MQDPAKKDLFRMAPTQQELLTYHCDVEGVSIINNPRRTISMRFNKGQVHPKNAVITYEYSESVFHCGTTDEVMWRSRTTNVRDAMSGVRWMDPKELVDKDYVRMSQGKRSVFQLLQAVTIIIRWDGQER